MHRCTMFPLLLLGLSVASPVWAQGPSSPPDADYLAAVGRGLVASRSGDRAGAMAAFGEAARLFPSRPEAVCLLAETHRLVGDHQGALASYQSCLQVAREAGEARWIARALHGIAATLERFPARLDEARAAWQEYVRFADGVAAVALPSLGRARITAIDQVTELARIAAEVRERIVQRERERAEEAARRAGQPSPGAGGGGRGR